LKNLSHPENQKDKQHEQTIKETIFNPSRGKFPKATGKKQAKKTRKTYRGVRFTIPDRTGKRVYQGEDTNKREALKKKIPRKNQKRKKSNEK